MTSRRRTAKGPRNFRQPAGWIVVGVNLAVLGAAGCRGGTLTEQDVRRVVDEQLAAKASSAPSSKPPTADTDGGIASPPGTSGVAETAEFLAALTRLMADYHPAPQAAAEPNDPLRCLTSEAVETEAELKPVAAKVRQRRDADMRERERLKREFYGTAYGLQFRIDESWSTRIASVVVPGGCWAECGRCGYGTEQMCGDPSSKAACEADPHCVWKESYKDSGGYASSIRDSGRYSRSSRLAPPAMMTQMEREGVKAPARFHCLVVDVKREADNLRVTCESGADEKSMILLHGAPPKLNAGDIVSVPLAGEKREPEGVLFKRNVQTGRPSTGLWVVDADAASMRVVAAATCPSMQDVVSSVETKKR